MTKRIAIFLIATLWCAIGVSQTHEFNIFLDLDIDSQTGCIVNSVDGPFMGVETALRIRLDRNTGMVTSMERLACNGVGFAAPIPISGTPFPIGFNLGVDGSNVIEAVFPMSGIQTTGTIRVAVQGINLGSGEEDALITDTQGGPLEIFLFTPVPLLGPGGMMVLISLIFMISLWFMVRLRKRRYAKTGLFFLIFGLMGMMAASIILDGDPGDWFGVSMVGQDTTGDSNNPDLVAVYATFQNQQLFFRIDSFLNSPPTVNGQNQTLLEDNSIPLTLTGFDTDGDSLTFSISSGPTHGNLGAITPVTATSANVTYTPDPDYFGNDSFTFTANDGSQSSADGTVTLQVTAVNDAPSFTPGSNQSTNENSGLQTVVGWATFINPGPANESGQALTFNVIGNTNPGLFTAGPAIAANGTLTYTSTADTSGNATITLTLSDDGGTANGGIDTTASIQFDIEVLSVNSPPTVVDETFDGTTFPSAVGNTTLEFANTSSVSGAHVFVAGSVLDNDSDPNSDPITIVSHSSGTNGGVVAMNSAGEFTYQPPLGFNGSDTFTYTVSDGVGGQTTGTVTINIVDVVWYVDNNASPGDGSSEWPFESLYAFNTAQNSGAGVSPGEGDYIFFYSSGTTYNDGQSIALKNSQHLIGHGVDLVVNGTVLLSAGSNPSVTSSNYNVIILADDNTVEGLTLLPSIGAGISGNALPAASKGALNKFGTNTILRDLIINPSIDSDGITFYNRTGTLTVANVNIQGLPGCTGSGIVAATSNLTLDFDDLNIQFPIEMGLSLTGMSGTMTATNVTLATNNTALNISGGDMQYTFDGTSSINQTTGGAAINAQAMGNGTSLSFGSANLIHVSNLAAVTSAINLDASNNDVFIFLKNLYLDATTGGDALAMSNFGSNSMVALGETALTIPGAGQRGIYLNNINFSLNFLNTVSITNTVTAALLVDGGTGILGFDGTITNNQGPSIIVSGKTGGSLTVSGAVQEQGPGGGIKVMNSTGSYSFDSLTLGSPGSRLSSDPAILLDSNSGTINMPSLQVYTDSGQGFVAIGGAQTLNVNSGGTPNAAIIDTVNAVGIQISNATMNGNFSKIAVNNPTGSGVLFDTNSGTTNIGLLTIVNAGGIGLSANSAGTLNVTDNTSSIQTSNDPAIDLLNSTVGLTFQRVSSTLSSFYGVSMSNTGGLLTINDGNAGTTDDLSITNSHDGFMTNGSSVTINVDSASISGITSRGFELVNQTGPMTLSGGSINSCTGTSFYCEGGSSNLTCNANIGNTSGGSIAIINRPSGVVSFGGSVTDTGEGIALYNNSACTFNFNGVLTLNTGTFSAFTAQNSGTVSAPMPNLIGNVSPLSTTAVNIADTTIGASGIHFQSVSVSGATEGIVLNNTGPNGFYIDGNGTTGSGGTFANIVNRGVEAISTNNLNLNYITFTGTPTATGSTCITSISSGDNTLCNAAVYLEGVNTANLVGLNISGGVEHGINGYGVSGLAMDSCTLNNVGDTPTSDQGIKLFNLTGTCSMVSNNITASANDNVRIQNDVSTALNLTVGNGSSGNNFAGSLSGAGFLLSGRSGTTMTLVFDNNDVNNNFSSGLVAQADDSSSTGGQMDFTVTNCNFHDNGAAAIDLNCVGGHNMVFDINHNGTAISPILNHGSHVINVNQGGPSTGLCWGTIDNNFIGSGANSSGTTSGSAIRVVENGTGDQRVVITNNTLKGWTDDGINCLARDVGSSIVNLTISNNIINSPNGSFPNAGIFVQSGAINAATETHDVCNNINNNTVNAGGGAVGDIWLRQRFFTSMSLYKGSSGSATASSVLSDLNAMGGFGSVISGTVSLTTAACDTP